MTSRIDAIVAFDRRSRLAQIRTPTLVVVAADDMVTPRFYSEELAERISGAKLVVLADSRPRPARRVGRRQARATVARGRGAPSRERTRCVTARAPW